MWDFTGSPVWRMRHNGVAGGALRGGSGDSPSLLAPLFQEEWEFVMSKSSCWNRRVNHHCPAWTRQGWLGCGGNEAGTVFIHCLHVQKSSSMWCIRIYEYKLYLPGPWAHLFPTSAWCLAALARGMGVQSLRDLWETAAGLTLLFKAAFRLWALLSQAPPRPHPHPISGAAFLARPRACDSDWRWLGHCLVTVPSLAWPSLPRWGLREGTGWRVRVPHRPGSPMALASPLQSHIPSGAGTEMQKMVLCCSPEWHLGHTGSKGRFLLRSSFLLVLVLSQPIFSFPWLC